MATEAELYLRKAQESLSSAEADLEAGRYNSVANRAYYAAFQAAVAALITAGIQPATTKNRARGNWEHRFVSSQFPGKLVWRTKAYPSELAGKLNGLFGRRIDADYQPVGVSRTEARESLLGGRSMVSAISKKLAERSIGEPKAVYEEKMTSIAKRKPKDYVEDVKNRIHASHPNVAFEIYERGPRDFTLAVYRDENDDCDVHEAIGDLTARILVNEDVWIVISQRRREPQPQA